MNFVKQSRLVEQDETRRTKAECLNKQILKNQRDALIKFTKSLLREPKIDPAEVASHLSKFISACQHLKVYRLQFPKESDTYTVRYKMKEHIKELAQLVRRVTTIVELLPQRRVVAALKRKVWLMQINFTFKTLSSL